MPSFYDTAYSPNTSLINVTAATPIFPYTMPLNSIGMALSRPFTTSSVTGSRTWPEKLSPSHVRNKPLILAGCAVKKPKENTAQSKATTVPSTRPPLEAMEQKGDLLIHDLWNNETESVHDMHVVNKYANSHSAKTPEKCLQEAERAKKKMYLEACLQQR